MQYFQQLEEELRCYLLLLGAQTPKQLRKVPLVVTGETKDFIACRGYGLAQLCRVRRA